MEDVIVLLMRSEQFWPDTSYTFKTTHISEIPNTWSISSTLISYFNINFPILIFLHSYGGMRRVYCIYSILLLATTFSLTCLQFKCLTTTPTLVSFFEGIPRTRVKVTSSFFMKYRRNGWEIGWWWGWGRCYSAHTHPLSTLCRGQIFQDDVNGFPSSSLDFCFMVQGLHSSMKLKTRDPW